MADSDKLYPKLRRQIDMGAKPPKPTGKKAKKVKEERVKKVRDAEAKYALVKTKHRKGKARETYDPTYRGKHRMEGK